jgi:hypothetical protein
MPRVRSLSSRVAGIAVFVILGTALFGAFEFSQYRSRPLVTMVHLPDTYPRRGASLSANVTTRVSKRVKNLEYRVNGRAWRRIADLWSVRFVNRVVTFEMPVDDLKPGLNQLEIVADAPLRPQERHVLSFSYDPSPIALPVRRVWKDEQLEAQDGSWEVVEVEGEWRVRPELGYEGYDRILLVAGAFPVPRRIETYAVFRSARPSPRNEVGFGVLSLWGGHPGAWSHLPRRGWSFAMGLYWSKPGGVGSEISHYEGTSPPKWVNSYRDTPLLENERYYIIIEVDDVRVDGRHDSYRQRVKIWPESQAEPDEWVVLTDEEGARLPEGEYSVALFTLDSQVEFGPIDVLPLPATSSQQP